MNTTLKISLISSSIALVMMSAAAPAFAKTSTLTASVSELQASGDQQIAKLTNTMSSLMTHVQKIKQLSDVQVSSITNGLQAEITQLSAEKGKIDTDTTAAAVQADIKTLRPANQVQPFIVATDHILLSSEKVTTLTGQMTTVTEKFEERVTAAKSGGKDTAAAQATIVDAESKIADATTQTTAAETEIASMASTSTDSGNSVRSGSYKAMIKDAAAKITTATSDLQAARADMDTLRTQLKALKA